MDWNYLTSAEQLEEADSVSREMPVLIYKHSTRCHICSMALSRIERGWDAPDYDKVKPYFLDVLKHREVSDAVAQRYGIEHQSPQVLLIRNGKCIYSESHSAITYNTILSSVG